LRGRALFGPDGLRAYVLFSDVGTAVVLLDAGARAQDAAARVRAVGVLVRSLAAAEPRVTLRAINVPPGDPLGDVMPALGCAVVARQREMRLSLPI
jgi:hypothetical protein